MRRACGGVYGSVRAMVYTVACAAAVYMRRACGSVYAAAHAPVCICTYNRGFNKEDCDETFS